MKKLFITCLVLSALCTLAMANGGGTCATATVINPTVLPFSETGQFDGDDDCQVPAAVPYNEVFYTFTPNVTNVFQFRVRSYSTAAPAIRILSGACCTSGTSVNVFYSGTSIPTDCANPVGTGYEPATVVTYGRALLTAGTQYWIQVGTSTTTVTTANYDFMMTSVPSPNWETVNVHNTCATAQAMVYPDSITGRAGPTTPDWYTFTVAGPNPDSVLIFVGGDEFGHCNSGLYPGDNTHAVDARFTLFKGCGGSVDSIGYSDNEGCANDALKAFCLAPATYYLKVWNYSDTTQYVMTMKSLGLCGQTSGKCVYGLPCTPTCQNLTQPYCTALGGTWTVGATCTGWTAPVPGDICCAAVPITTIPYTDAAGTLVGYAYDYAPTCLGSYGTGPDRVYLLTLTSPMRLRARLTNFPSGAAPAIGIFDACPTTGNCLATATTVTAGNVSTPFINLAAGTYYILVDDLPIYGYYSFAYTLIVTDQPADCNELYALCGTPGETEPNNTVPSQVDPTQLGCASTIYGRACGGTDHDVFPIVVPARKSLTVQVRDGASCSTFPADCARSDLYDATGLLIGADNTAGWQIDNTAYTTLTRYIDVHPAAAACTTTYKVTTTCLDLYDCATMPVCGTPVETEPNDTYTQYDATQITASATTYGKVCPNGDRDVFRIVVPARQAMTLQLYDGNSCTTLTTNPPACVRSSLLDELGNVLQADRQADWLITNSSATTSLVRFIDVHAMPACSTSYKIVSTLGPYGGSCALLGTIPSVPFTDTGNFDGDLDCNLSGFYPPYNDITYSFIPNVSGPYQFRLRNYTTGAGAIRIISGQCCTSGTSVSVAYSATSVPTDCPNPTAPGNEPATVVTYTRAVLTAGTQYWVKVGTAASTASTAAYDLMVVSVPCPPSESPVAHSTCATAQPLTNYSISHFDSITGIASGHDWYSFTVNGPNSDSVRIYCGYNEFGHCNSGVSATANSTFGLYRGCAGQTDSIGSGLDQACNFDALNSFCLAPGTYYLDVSSNDATNPYVLSLSYLGTCSPPTGRCCYTQAGAPTCGDVTLTACTALGGTWASSLTCAANPCPTGRCCYGTACDGTCLVTLQPYCAALSGTWTAGATCLTACPRDTLQGNLCCNAFPISSFPYTHVWHTIGYSYSYAPSCLGTYGTGPDVVYTFTLTAQDRVKLTLTGVDAGADPGIGIFSGCPDTAPCMVTASGAGNISTAFVDLPAGTYYVLVDDLPIYGHYSYNYTLTVSDTVPNRVAGVTATTNRCDSVVVTWTDVTGENGYRIFRDAVLAGTTAANVSTYVDAPAAGTYNYTVLAYNLAGNSQASTPASGTRLAIPGQVTNVAATDSGCSNIIVTWTDVVGASGYHVFRDAVDLGPVNPGVQTLTDAAPAGTYVYKVVASNICGTGPFSNTDQGTRLALPAAAMNVLATDNGCANIVVTWTDAPGATAYQIYRDTTPLGSIAAGVQTFTDTPPAGTYNYKVVSSNACGNGPDSNIDPGTRLVLPPAATNVVATDVNCADVVVTWTDAVGATGYHVWRDATDLGAVSPGVQTLTDTPPAGSYNYMVVSSNACGNGPNSNVDPGTRLGTPSAATNVVATDASCVDVVVTWTDAVGATGYHVWRDLTDLGLINPGVQTFTDTPAAGTYNYKVVSLNACGNGPDSNVDPGTRLAAPATPLNVTATTDRCDKIVVTWNAVSGATGYKVYLGGLYITTVTTPTYEDVTSTSGSYTVSAVNGNGGGCASVASTTANGIRLVAPATPANVAATTDRCDKIVVTWNAVGGAAGYKVYVGGVYLTTVAVTTYEDLTNTSGLYTVTAISSSGVGCESAPSPGANGSKLSAPLTPAAVTATMDRCDKIVVSWNAVSGATGYKMYVDGVFVTTVTATTYDDATSTSASYAVAAINGSGPGCESPLSTPVNGAKLTAPSAPTNVIASTDQCGKIIVTWNAVIGATGYKVHLDGAYVTTVTAPTYEDLASTTGSYTVSAINGSGAGCESPMSMPALGARATPPAAASNVVATDTRCADVVITWADALGATSYHVWRGTQDLGPVNPGVQSFTDTPSAGVYSYTVIASNLCGNGPASTIASGTRVAMPATPANVMATTDRCDKIVVTWNGVSGATEYKVYLGGVIAATVTGTSYEDLANTSGAYSVAAINGAGLGCESAASSPVNGARLAAPATPVNLSATADRCDKIVVTWDAVGGATGYKVYRGGVFEAAVNATSYEDLTNVSGAYTVSAVSGNGAGCESPASIAANGTRLAVPAAPLNVLASTDRCDRIVLTWDVVNGATAYKVYRGGSYVTTVTGTTYEDMTTVSGSYTVSAMNGSGQGCEGVMSASASGARATIPPAATNVSASDTHCADVVITWTDAAGATGYHVWRNAVDLGPVGQGVQTFTDTPQAGTYTYKVVSLNACGNGPDSNTDSGTRITTPPTATNVVATDTQCADVVITWTDAAGATGYHVWRDATDLGLVNPGVQTLTDTPPAGTYNYKVVSSNACGNGPNSNVDPGTRLSAPLAATNVVATDANCADIVITWTDAVGATSYHVFRGAVDLGAVNPGVQTLTDTPPAGTYVYKVVSMNTCGNGPESNTDSGTRMTTPLAATSVVATDNSCTNVVITWTDAVGATGYHVWRDAVDLGLVNPGVQTFTDSPSAGSYTYKVVSLNSCGNGPDSNTDLGTRVAAPLAATHVLATDTHCTDVVITWTDAAEATGYHVWRDGTDLGSVGQGVQTFTDTPPAGTYTYKVVSLNACGNGPDSNTDSGTRLAAPLAATNVAATDASCANVIVTWTDAVGATGYHVWRDAVDLGLVNPAVQTFTDTPAAGTYTYKVVSLNTCGNGPDSNTDLGTRLVSPPAATQVAATDNSCISVVITWTDAVGATGYHVWRDAVDLGLVNPGVQTLSDTPPAGTYTYKVVSLNSCGNGADSNTDTGTRITNPPAATNVVATDTHCADVVITWTDASGATGYHVWRDAVDLGQVGQGVQTFTDTPPAGTYTYKVVSLNTCGNGSDSNTDSGTRITVPPAATNVAATDASCANVVVTWTDAVGATSYHVWRDATDLGAVNPGVQTFTDTPAAGTYTYKIVSSNACGNGPDSNTDSGTRLAAPPAATNVVATDTHCADVVITWTDAVGATGYHVWRDAVDLGLVNPGVQTYTDAPPAGTYTYKVVSLNTCGNGPNSNTDSGTRLTTPSAATHVAATTDRCADIVVTWTDAPGATSYHVLRDAVDAGTVNAGVQTFTDTPPAGTYAYTVVASNACGNGPTPLSVQGTRLAGPGQVSLRSPADSTWFNVGSSQDFCWNSLPNATQYRVQWDNESTFSPPYDEQTTADTCKTRLMSSGGVVYWRVRGENSCGNGSWSNYGFVIARPHLTFSMSSPVAGCGDACHSDTLFIRFTGVGYYAGQVILQLPAGLVPGWSGVYNASPSAARRTANLQLVRAIGLSGNQVEVNVLWGPRPLNSTDDGQYCAVLPLLVSAMNIADTLHITDLSYNFTDVIGEHTTGVRLDPTFVLVDCIPPVATFTGGAGESSCNAYSSATEFAGAIAYSASAGAAPNTPLDHAYISLGSTQWPVNISGGTWPTGSETPDVWTTMTEGCNTFVLHVFDGGCNETIDSLAGVIKDTTPPTVAANPLHQPLCYNNDPTSPQYGRNLIAADLNITASAGNGSCIASQNTMQLRHNGHVFPASPVALPVMNWPQAADTAGLWDWIVAELANGAPTFEIIARDCAGNVTTPIPTFDICGDFTAPGNSVAVFDARPTHLGVWLKWSWNYDATQNDSMEIWRKGEDGYPTYGSHLWSNLSTYETLHSNLVANGWTRVLVQAGADGFASSAYDPNPADHYVDPIGGDYWKDVIGTDATPQRDIYRYVTFIRDAAGNWSGTPSYTIGTNADRSTNYWLGDYSVHAGNPMPTGVVNTVDLNMLSVHYFQDVQPEFSYLNIGPENHENGYGKGLPSPDGAIDFFDLVPFSFNFGIVANGGFIVRPPVERTFGNLDNVPIISAARVDETPIHEGDEFTVTVSLSGNQYQAAKAVEAVLTYNGYLVELVSATASDIEVENGIPWSAAKAVPGEKNKVVIAAAAMGEEAAIRGDGVLAVLKFRWKSEHGAEARFELGSVKMSDGSGEIITTTGSTLTIGGLGDVPTAYALFQNYPNPFNPSTTINFDLKENGFVKLSVFNILGQKVAAPVNRTMEAGRHSVSFDASGLPSGLYIYRLEVNGFTALHKMLLMR